jgi:hypothetical protein
MTSAEHPTKKNTTMVSKVTMVSKISAAIIRTDITVAPTRSDNDLDSHLQQCVPTMTMCSYNVMKDATGRYGWAHRNIFFAHVKGCITFNTAIPFFKYHSHKSYSQKF